MEDYYVYTGLLIGTIIVVFLPFALIDIYGGTELEDVQPYGIFKVTLSIVDNIFDTAFGFAKLLIVSSTIDEALDYYNSALQDYLYHIAQIYTLIPVPIFIVVFVPYIGAMIYAFIKMLPTT